MNRERSTRGSNTNKFDFQIENKPPNVDRPLKEIDYNFTTQVELLRTKFVQNLQHGDFFIATCLSRRLYFRKHTRALISEQPDRPWPRFEEHVFLELIDRVPDKFSECEPIKSFFDENDQVQFCFRKL